MYCPKCLCDTLSPNPHGVVQVIINGKQMDAGRFLYNTDKQTKQEIANEMRKKLDEFFRWYSSFQNKKPIKAIELNSSDFFCSNSCRMDLGWKSSVIGVIISQDALNSMLAELAQKYNLSIEFKA